MKRFAALALCVALLFSLPAFATTSVTTARIVYQGSGSTGPFSIPFYFAADSEITVTKIDTTTLATVAVLVLDTDYTVTGEGTTSGYVTLTTTLSSLYKLVIQRSTDFLQATDLVDYEPFSAETLEGQHDKETRELQELKDEVNRSVRLLPGVTDTTINPHLANPAASTVIGWDSTGKALTNYTTTTLSVPSIDMLANYDDLAAAVAAIGSTPKTLMVTAASAPDENSTIPCTLKLFFVNGGALNPAAGVVVTICSPDNIIAQPDQEIFGGAGSIVFQKPGTIYVDWWGPDKTGATDAYADLNASIESVPATSTVVFGSGEYLLETGLYVHTGVNLKGNCSAKLENNTYASTIKAGVGATDTLLEYYAAQPYSGRLTIECLTLDGNDIATHGLEIKQAIGLKVYGVTAYDFTDKGLYVNGWGNGYPDEGEFSTITFEQCWSGLNGTGYAVDRTGTGYFGSVTFRDCLAYYNDTGVFLAGDNATAGVYYGFSVKWSGGKLEGGNRDMNATKADAICTTFRVKDGVTFEVENAYTEIYSNYCDAGEFHYWVSNNSFIEKRGGNLGLTYWYNKVEDNSTICQGTPGVTESTAYRLYGYGPVERFCIGRTANKKTWGPPNFPISTEPSGGYAGYYGQTFTDIYGIKWKQIESESDNGTGGSSIYHRDRWIPPDGKIIIPISIADLNYGNTMAYWNQADFVVTDVMLVAEGAVTCSGGGGYIKIGQTPRYHYYINETQGAEANLTAGSVIHAIDNDNSTGSALGTAYTSISTSTMDDQNGTDGNLTVYTSTSTTARHRSLLMPGYSPRTMVVSASQYDADWESTLTNSYIGVYPSCGGTWSGGPLKLIITGYPMEY